MGFIYTIPPTGGWLLDDMSQPATFVAGTGIIGPKGDKGDTGNTGGQGPQGPQGDAATIAVGTTSTLAPGSPATVANAGTSSEAVFNFGIPAGEKGDKGDQGDKGDKGDKGDQGDTGATGATGPQGPAGVVAATAPIQYDAPTQTVSIDPAYKPNPFDQSLNTTDNTIFNTVFGTVGFYLPTSGGDTRLTPTSLSFGEPADIDGVANLIFTDATTQTTAGLSPADAASTYYPLTNPSGYVTAATAPVTSVAGKTGAVTLAVADVSGAAQLASSNTFTASQVVEVTDNTNAALRITQLGTGEAFRVEDSANPDTTPFVISADGNVGIGRSATTRRLEVSGSAAITGTTTLENATTGSALLVNGTASSTSDCVRITNLGSGNSFVVEDSANPDSSPFVIDSQGRVAVGSNVVSNTNFTVVGTSQFSTSSGTPVSILVSNTAAGVTGLGIDYRGTGDAFRIANNTAERFVVDTNGNTEIAGSLKIGTSQALTGVATDAEAVAGASTTLAVTPAGIQAANLGEIVWDFGINGAASSATSGAGAAVGQTNSWNKSITGPTTVAGFASLRSAINGHYPGLGWNSSFNFDYPMFVDLVAGRQNGTDANSEGWVTIGDGGTIANNGAPNDKSFGIKVVGGDFYGFVHDGTTLSVSGTFVNFGVNSMRRIGITSNGLGTVSFNIDGTTFTMTGGPVGVPSTSFRNAISMKVVNTTTLTGSALTLLLSRLKLKIR